MEKLRNENEDLKKALTLLMNRSLIKKLSEALERINSDEYLSEEEFFNQKI